MSGNVSIISYKIGKHLFFSSFPDKKVQLFVLTKKKRAR